MKQRFVYRCPFCGAWYTHSKGDEHLVKAIAKAKKEGKVAWVEKIPKSIGERPKFNILTPYDPMVMEMWGQVPVGKYSLYQALVELPEEELEFLKRKIKEIKEQCRRFTKFTEEMGI